MRTARIERSTGETEIRIALNLDAAEDVSIQVPNGFFRHMLELFSFHGRFSCECDVRGDTDVDLHHTVEDTAICLGQAFRTALGDKKGIKRCGCSCLPMDEVLVNTCLDISGRPFLVFNVPIVKGREGSFEVEDTRELLRGLVVHSGITLHVNLAYGDNLHHINEAIFKSLGIALKQAIKIQGAELPSTKGIID